VAEKDEAALARIVEAMRRIVQDPDADRRIEADAQHFLEEALGNGKDAEATAAQGPARMLLYRRLVRRGLGSAIRAQLPITAQRLGRAFDAYIERWLDERMPRSHYLRDVAGELAAWALPLWAEDPAIPRWAADLARHEIATFEVGSAPSGDEERSGPLALGARARFHATARVVRYAFAVQRMSLDDGGADPEETPTALFLYRDAEHEVRSLSLSPLAAAILERLLGGATLGRAVTEACEATAHPLDQAILEGTAAVLADLADRGALLGKGPEEGAP
jgi:hypothetical protein